MSDTLTRNSFGGVVAALVLVLAGATASADLVVQLAPDGRPVVRGDLAARPAELRVLDYGPEGISLTVSTPDLVLRPRKLPEGEFVELTWPQAKPYGAIGAPALPVVRRLFIAPPGATVELSWSLGQTATLDQATTGLRLIAFPRQAPVAKLPGALQNAPFDFDPGAYAVDADQPAALARIEELGIIRGQRLLMLEVYPVAYNPAAETITFRPQITLEVRFSGASEPPSVLSPLPGLERVVLNPDRRAAGDWGTGNYLIVVPTVFEDDIAPFADAKSAQGFRVLTHAVAPGTSNTAIRSYIESLWNTPDAPDYVLLVGDTDRMPYWVGGGSGSPSTDLPYVCMDGPGDWYPDIALGRFPARDSTQLATLINKTLYYENGPLADPQYKKRAAFMAGVDNNHISEGTHNYCIDTWLEPAGYQCDRLYMVTEGATTEDVRNSFNDGRFYGIYSGHGATTYWADGPPFYPSDVNGLINANMYAFICSFACYTGDYVYPECFMETWVLAPNKAGLASWGSTVTSYWTEDDILQRVLFDAIFDNSDDVKTEAGPIYNEAKLRFLDYFGPTSTTRRYFEMYNLLGDPSLPLPSSCPDAGEIALDRPRYGCESTATITVLDCGLNQDDNAVETVDVTIASDSEPTGETVTLYETEAASAEFAGAIELSTTNAPGVLLVAEGDTVTATYIDEDDGQGHQVVVTATATVDCTPPVIWNVRTTDIEPRSATVRFEANEPVRGTVRYGLSCGNLTQEATGSGYSTSPLVELTGLSDDTTYYYIVIAEDEAGNQVTDDNHGSCYSFTTPAVPDFFTELFDGSENDLDGWSLLFRPDGSPDFYAGCAEQISELPTDPAGGTTLYLSDDDYEYVSVGGNERVWLYGVSYDHFYVGSNGYITFTGGDADYTESLEDHFDVPRVSGLFDDLDPRYGGTISWKRLADRAAVTWQGVPEHGSSNSNTFQIELFFDGQIRMSYLRLDATDGLAGLSEGRGLDPDYYPTDLSAMPPCGPAIPGDLDGDGDVDLADLAQLLSNYGMSEGAVYEDGDIDGDGDVDMEDLAILLSHYGEVSP